MLKIASGQMVADSNKVKEKWINYTENMYSRVTIFKIP